MAVWSTGSSANETEGMAGGCFMSRVTGPKTSNGLFRVLTVNKNHSQIQVHSASIALHFAGGRSRTWPRPQQQAHGLRKPLMRKGRAMPRISAYGGLGASIVEPEPLRFAPLGTP